MYGKWLYKEISTEYGACKVEIYRKNYTGVSIEIGALAANSLSIALENLGSITDPIGKSVCSFSIIDTDQVEYDDFFTPDATALKVVVSTRVGSGAYVTRWSGYVTPDFFTESLSYRTPISISARDNIGYLNDVDFDLTATTITVRELIQSAFKRIAEDYPMSLSFVTQKQTAEGILAIDATISTTLLREISWGEALETILHDLGLQMRWVDNNTIAVLDLSQIPEYYAIQGFNFVDASGYREIVPAWRELSQEQDFGLKENFFEGWLREDNITFVKSVVMRPPNATNWTTDIAYYVPNNWGVARDIYTTDPSYYGSKFGKKIFFTGVSEQNPTTTYFSWRQQIQSSIVPMKMSFKAFNSVLYPSEKYASLTTPSGRRLVAYNPKDAFHGQKVGEYLQIGLKANVLLHSGLKTYILKSEWVEISDDGAGWQLDFTLPKVELSYIEGNQATAVEPREEEITINIATIPYDGELEFRIYGWYIVGKHNYWEDDYSVTNYTFDWLKCLAYINEPTFSFNTDEADSGRETNVMIAEAHNIKQEESYTFGQTFNNGGGLNAYAGALVGTDGNELIGFQRNANATNYNLLELVGRELIHFNKRNYNRLSGTIRNLNKEPLMFNRLFVREGKKYAPYNYSLNVISNEMNITSMQEVEPYETATFNTIDSQITTGGGTVSGGNNTILQYSEEAGNEKRLYELQTATEQEMNDAYVLVDRAGFPEARKVHISELGGFDVRELEQYLEKNGYTALKTYWTFNEQDDTLRTTHNIVVEGGGAFGMGAESGDVPSASVSIKFEGSDVLYNPTNGVITLPAYPSAGGGVADSVAWSNITGKPNFATVATSGKYSDLSGTPTIPTSLKSPYALTFGSKTYDGSAAKTITASDLGALTAHQTIYALTINNSAGTAQVTYTPNSKAASLTLTKAMVGLSNVENTALSTWVGSAKITTLGTITSGTWNGTKIANGYLANSSMTIAGTSVSLGSSITAATLKTNLGLGSFAYISSLAFSSLTDKPTTLAGYGITDKVAYRETWNNFMHNGNEFTFAFPAYSGFIWINYRTASGNTDGAITEYRFAKGAGVSYADIRAAKYIINGGTSSQFLKGDGSLDSTAYLPLSGGTITGPLGISSSTKPTGNIGFWSASDIGFIMAKSSLKFYKANTQEYFDIIHSGNIGSYSMVYDMSADGEYASSTKFNTVGYGNTALDSGWKTYGPILTFGIDVYHAQLQKVYNSDTLYIRSWINGAYTDWKTIAFTDSNVASATKLQTARTIWGQNFDGSGNVSGALYNTSGQEFIYSSGNLVRLGTGTAAKGCNTYIDGNNIYLRYGTTYKDGITLASSGNVLIGLSGNYTQKLVVDGDALFIKSLTSSHWGALTLSYSGSWGGHRNYIAGIDTTDGVGLVGRYGVTYNGSVGVFVVRDMFYGGSYGASGVLMEVLGSGQTNIYGNLTVTGGGAFGSDIRYKDITSYRQLDLETIVNAPLFTFKWTDREDKVEHLGTSAQYWLGTQFKDAVNTANKDFFHLDYGALGVGIGISVAREVKGVKTEVQILREKVNQLEQELAQYRRA